MKTKKRKFLAVLSSAVAVSMLLSTNVFAASSVSGSMGGTSVYGSISMGVDKATGTTTCGASNCSSYVKTTYYYRFGDASVLREVTAENQSAGHGVTAVANAENVPARNVSAKGEHKTSNSNYSWTDYTDIK